MNLKKTASFLLLPLCLSLISCIEEAKAPDDTPATAREVQTALIKAWGQADPLSMETNDFLFQETQQTIENNPSPIFVLQEGVTVSSKVESSTEWVYKFLYQTRTFKNGQEGSLSTREDSRTVSKETAHLSAVAPLRPQSLEAFAEDYQMSLGFEKFLGLAYACQVDKDFPARCKKAGYDSCEIKCVNLKTETSMVPAPDLMKTQPDCGGLTSCQMQTQKVSFDWLVTLTKGSNIERQRVNYSIRLSPDLPFMARVTEYCFRQLFPVQNQKILVNTCTTLKNFKKGGS